MSKSGKLKKFLNSELTKFPLSKQFINALNKVECYTVGHTILLGRKRVADLKGIGIGGMSEFDYLLFNYKCISMFV
jgi:hypothetical protein